MDICKFCPEQDHIWSCKQRVCVVFYSVSSFPDIKISRLFNNRTIGISLHAQCHWTNPILIRFELRMAFHQPLLDPPHERRRHSPDDHEQLIPIVVPIQPPAGYVILVTNMGHTVVPLLASYQGFQPPEMQMASLQRQPPLRFPEQVQQSEGASAVAFQPSFESRQALDMQESSSPQIYREGQVFSLDVSNFVTNRTMLEIYYNVWSRSSNGVFTNIRDLILPYSHDLLKQVIVTDAACTHVPITLNTASLDDVVRLLQRGIVLCNGIVHAYAIVLIVRLKRRIACIYFRQHMLTEARREIDEVLMIINVMLKDCVDVGIADAYWLSAWIRLFEVWENDLESLTQLDASKDILRHAEIALEIARKLPDEHLRMAYSGRIACNLACLKLLIASHCSGRDARAELEQQATELVNQISPDTLARRDQSLWCRAKLWLSLQCSQPSERILDRIIDECRDVDKSNSVFTWRSVHHRDIEQALHGDGD